MNISPDVVILTNAELEQIKREAFRKGVDRGRFEEGRDRAGDNHASDGKESEGGELCSDCPPVGYETDRTRCKPCPRRKPSDPTPPDLEAIARIIDPDTYHAYDIHKRAGTVAENGKPWCDLVCGKDIAAALDKADRILALRGGE